VFSVTYTQPLPFGYRNLKDEGKTNEGHVESGKCITVKIKLKKWRESYQELQMQNKKGKKRKKREAKLAQVRNLKEAPRAGRQPPWFAG
jgi:hypothetical protein